MLWTSEIVRNFIVDEIGLEGITLNQYNMLRILRTRLVSKHLVVRERCTEDGRIRYSANRRRLGREIR